MRATGERQPASTNRATRRAPVSEASRADLLLGALAIAVTTVVMVAVGWHLQPGVPVLGLLVTAAVAPALARIDLAEQRLPNRFTVPIFAVGAVCATGVALAGAWIGLLVALGAIVVLLALWLGGGMGAGDVKLGGGLALVLAPVAWWGPLAALAVAFMLGGVAGLVGRMRGETAVPFGPWLLVGGAVAVGLAAAAS